MEINEQKLNEILDELQCDIKNNLCVAIHFKKVSYAVYTSSCQELHQILRILSILSAIFPDDTFINELRDELLLGLGNLEK